MPRIIQLLCLILPLAAALPGGNIGAPDSWIPARWTGGPLEIAVRAKTLPTAQNVRDAIANWYDPATLDLLQGSPINCLLVTWSAAAPAEIEQRHQALVKTYAAEAHRRGIAILGLVYSGAGVEKALAAATAAQLEGIILDRDDPPPSGSPAFPIAQDLAAARRLKGPVTIVRGVSPGSRNLADMGIRSAPSSEPWIESNIWLVRALRSAGRPIWVSHQPEEGSAFEYARAVADAAVAGGRWIVSLDDTLRARLLRRDPEAIASWRRIGAIQAFAAQHADWRAFEPYGNLGIIVDTAAADTAIPNEYLNLVARRQVPYRIVERSQLTAASLSAFQAVLASGIDPLKAAERDILRAFAEKGGTVVAGPSLGNSVPRDEPYAETAAGKGRVVIYREPDPESVARDLKDLLSSAQMGVRAFNVPSVITYIGTADAGKRLLVQLLNYSKWPADSMTIRVSGAYKTARLFTPDAAPENLPARPANGETEISIPKLALWGGLLME